MKSLFLTLRPFPVRAVLSRLWLKYRGPLFDAFCAVCFVVGVAFYSLACVLFFVRPAHAQSVAAVPVFTATCQASKSANSLLALAALCKTAHETYWRANGYPSCTYGDPVVSSALSFSLPFLDASHQCSAYPTVNANQSSTNQALPCPSAGDTRSINMTLGYTHDPSGDKSSSSTDYAGRYISMRTAGAMCASGGGSSCAVTFDASPPSMVWISGSPNAQGLYRISVDQKVVFTGASCTQTANEKMVTESTDAAPSCDGTYGVVNGKAVCVPANSGSRNLVQSQSGTTNTPRQVGNPAAGSNGGLPIASRTPSGGTGSNDGGPVTPLDGSPAPLGAPLPTTPVSKTTGDLQLTGQCGAAGQPACKIDETGTPSAPSMVLDTTSLNTQAASQRNTISGTADKGFFNGWSSIFSTPPVTACTPFAYPMSGVSVDPCPVVDGVRTVMAFLWALVGGWICLAWIKEAI